MKIRKLSLLALVLASLTGGFAQNASAVKEARPLAIDARIRSVTYQENEVFSFTGHYGYQSSIEFERTKEEVQTISIGDSTAWQIIPAVDRLFIKPIEQDATTNMTVITSKRIYHFELHAKETEDVRDPEMVFVMRFIYPDAVGQVDAVGNDLPIPELDDPSKYNFSYSITGTDNIAPIRIFDDGTFTYFEFKKGTDIPAFFKVGDDGKESVINYRSRGNYIVIERIAPRFTLRLGADIVCVYNDALYMKNKPAAQ